MKRLWSVAIGTSFVVGVVAGLGSRIASAQDEPGAGVTDFDGTASADGVRVGITTPGTAFTSQWVDVGAPTAQATLSSVHGSQAFAAMPYPGATLLALPGFLAPFFGLPPPPGYPLVASSSSSTAPQASVSEPGVSLTAASSEQSSRATARAGGDTVSGTAADAVAELDAETGEFVARATATSEATAIEGVLRIGRTAAAAEVVQTTGGRPRVTSSFEAEGITIAGVTVAVTDKGIVLPGRAMPIPDTSGLSPVLDNAGVSMAYVPATAGDADAVSAGLVVSVSAPGPTGTVVVTYTFGRASAHAGPVAATQAPVATSGPTGVSPTVVSPTPAAVNLAPAAPSASASVATQPPPSRPRAPAPAGRSVVASSSPISTTSFYLVLVVGALVMASGLYLVRLFGERLAWT